MERRGNYFMPNNGQIGFSPLHMLGLSAIHPTSMEHGFVDVGVNTHTVDNDFSLFKCKDQDAEIVNMKNSLMNRFGCGLPVGNSFSKLIGGFIGSKCLMGSSTGRENNFWGRVLQQYNNIIGTNNNVYISMSAMSSKETTGEYIKAGAVDAALLFSQSFELFNTHNLIPQEQTVDTTKSESPQESLASSVKMEVQETLSTEPKQSYAEVTKSRVVNKSPFSAALDRCSMGSKRLRSVQRNPVKLRQKKQGFDISSNNYWRNRCHSDDFGKHLDSTNYNREHRRKYCTLPRDNQHKAVTATNSTKGSFTPHTSEEQKMNHTRTRHVQHTASNRKFSGKKRQNSNLLSDIKEDCLGVDDDLMACEKNGSFNHRFSHSPNKNWTPSAEQISPSNHCANWRCRPYSLCDPCKLKDSFGNDITDCCGSNTQCETVTLKNEQTENDKDNNVPEKTVTHLTEEKPHDSSANPNSCSDSSVTEYEIFISPRCPMLRTRISSVCSVDSEDSFVIMFDAGGDESYEETSSETSSVCSDSDSDSDSSDDDEEEDEEEDDDGDYDDGGDDDNNDNEASKTDSQCLIDEVVDHHGGGDHYVFDYDSDDDEIDFDDDEEIEGVSYISAAELKDANDRWESANEEIPSVEKEPEKVHFAKPSELIEVHRIIAWDYAYRAARLGPWGTMARDRNRFQRRIEHVNRILTPVLLDEHRRKVWQKLHKETLDIP